MDEFQDPSSPALAIIELAEYDYDADEMETILEDLTFGF